MTRESEMSVGELDERAAKLRARVVRAAETALAGHGYVTAIHVLTGMGLLAFRHVEEWRRGLLPYLESAIQARPEKVACSLRFFEEWGRTRGLVANEVRYLARAIGPERELQFTATGDAAAERVYRIHYLPSEVPEKVREKLCKRLGKPPEIVVFKVRRDSRCSKCRAELPRGSFLVMERRQPFCLNCADLHHLTFLPRGNTALTRRARKCSSLSAVVVEWSRSRKRYERQGLLVEESALQRAEVDSLADDERSHSTSSVIPPEGDKRRIARG